MTETTTETLEELIRLTPAELRLRVQGGLPGGPCCWVEALRNEAGRFYNTDAAMARKIATRALEVAELCGQPLGLGWGHRAMAESLLFSGRMREAERSYAEAANAWRKAGANALLGQLLVGRIHVLSHLGLRKEAVAATREARRLLTAAGDHTYLAKLAMNLGTMHFQSDEYGPALIELERAAGLFRRLGVRDEAVLTCEVNRAVALSQLDRVEEALNLFSKIETECGRRGYELLEATVRMNAAYVHSLRADFDISLRDISRATSYFQETEHPAFLASCLLNRSEVYHQLNLHRDALDLAEQAVRLFGQEGLAYDEGLASSQAALSSLALNDLPSAMGRIKRGLSLFVREKNRSRVALMQVLWAEALYRKHRYRDAESRAGRALKAFQELGLIRWEAAATVLLDRLTEQRLTPDARVQSLRGLLRRIPSQIYPVPAYQLLEALGRAQERGGHVMAATQTYRRALNRLDELRVRIPTEDSKIAFLHGKTDLYDRMLCLEMARPRTSPGRLFEWMERSRAQSLWDRIRDPAAYFDEAGPPAAGRSPVGGDNKRLAAMRRRLSWYHSRMSRLELGSDKEREQAVALRRDLIQAEILWSRSLREQAERGTSGKQGRRSAARPRAGSHGLAAAGAPSIEDVGRALPRGWGFLSYHIGPDLALALMITSAGAVWRRLAPDLGSRLARLADRLDFQWGAAVVTSVRKAQPNVQASPTVSGASGVTDRFLRESTDLILGELYELLWRPIVEMDAPREMNWIVSPHGPIHRIPLHALRGPDGYLAERIDLSIIPSARIWNELPSPPRGSEGVAYVAGVPSAELPAVEVEVARVCHKLSGWRVRTDLAPTRESFRRAAASAALVHVAAHGSLRKDNPAFSYLQLADGPLFVHDLSGFRLPASTVVLTACSSGRGAAPAGDEWIGLARGFLQAGASTVMASLWPIQDEPTLELIDLFYEGFAQGLSAPAALGRAMRELLRTRPHPWHWASFAVLGGA